MKAVRTISFDEQLAHNACEVHFALLKAERDHPELKNNPIWTIHRQDAYERFSNAFKELP